MGFAVRDRERRARYKAAGCCIECAHPPVAGGVRCQHHRQRAAERAKTLRVKRAVNGLCLDCRNYAKRGHSRCDEHLAWHLRWQKRYKRRRR